jgi:hypothetical protein
MSNYDFEKLSEQEKRSYLAKAKKIAEFIDGSIKAELYMIENFYVEAFMSFVGKVRKTIHACDHIPAIFRKELYERKGEEKTYAFTRLY